MSHINNLNILLLIEDKAKDIRSGHEGPYTVDEIKGLISAALSKNDMPPSIVDQISEARQSPNSKKLASALKGVVNRFKKLTGCGQSEETTATA